MKLKHPRTSIAFNLLSILGWVTAILFIFFMPYQKHPTIGDDGSWFMWIILVIITFSFIVISCITYLLEIILDVQYNNPLISKNKIYSCFFEFGFFLYTFPIIWLMIYPNYSLFPILYLIYSYILLKLATVGIKKLICKIKSKKQNL